MLKLKNLAVLFFVVMLTGCAGNADLPDNTKIPQTEANSDETGSESSIDKSDTDDIMDEVSETTEQQVKPEETGNVSDDLAETSQPNDSAKTAEKVGSDEIDTLYFKPSNTYQDILDNAYEVIIHRGADFVEADEIFSYIGIWESVGRDTDEALASIGYTFYDVDGNGIEELIIMDTNKESDRGDNRILTMYSLLDGKPVLVIDGWARNRYYLLNDGTFYYEGSGGAAYTTFATYRMVEDGISIEAIDYYFSDYRDDSFKEYWLAEGNWGWFHNTTGEYKIDESEWMEFDNDDVPREMMEGYLAQVKQLDLTFFETMKQ